LVAGIFCADPTIDTLPSTPLGACEAQCDINPTCNAYSVNSANSCFLKRTCDQRLSSPGATSGVPAGAQTDPDVGTGGQGGSAYTLVAGIFCADPTIDTLPSTPLGACEAQCDINPTCNAYSVNSANSCFLKRTCDQRLSSPGAISGVPAGVQTSPNVGTGGNGPGSGGLPTPAPTPGSVSTGFRIVFAKGCKDPNLADSRGQTRETCQAQCEARSDCRAFTVNMSGRCFLKATCNMLEDEPGDTSGLLDGAISGPIPAEGSPGTPDTPGTPPAAPAPAPGPDIDTGDCCPATGDGGELVGGFDQDEDDDSEDCQPWTTDPGECGTSENPGIRVGGITWYRMLAHKANPAKDAGNGIVEWQPFRDRKVYARMYWKGSELLGYFDQPVQVKKNGQTRISFLWASEGEQVDVCNYRDAKSMDCDECEEAFGEEYGDEKNAYRYMYREVRCYSGTGDFRVSLLDSGGKKIDKDGYGYWNQNFVDYKGLQWRFHPQACPKEPRAFHGPSRYVATSGSSWIRSNRGDDSYRNQWALGCDYVEDSKLGRRSFKTRMYGPDDGPMCLNLPNGELTSSEQPMTMIIDHKGEDDGEVEFNFKMEFNGASFDMTEKWEKELFPETIDAVSISYTNSRSFFKMKMRRIE